MEEVEKIAEAILLEELRRIGLKKLCQVQKKRRKVEVKVVYDVDYKLLPEPEKVVEIVDVTPRGKRKAG